MVTTAGSRVCRIRCGTEVVPLLCICRFARSLRAGQRAAAVMSLIHSARMNGHDPYVYLRDVLTRLPTQKNSQFDELLPHLWQP